MATLLDCRGLGKRFARAPVFHDLDLTVHAREIVSIVGPSGCGKTTLLRCIAGLETLSAGDIRMEGKSIDSQPANERPIVMMFQQPLLFPHMTVVENITYGLRAQKVNKKERRRQANDMLENVEMTGFEGRYPHELSGGQQQRVALARALIIKPKLLLLDEPFASLDANLRASIRMWARDMLKEHGVSALFVTHDREEAMLMGDRLAVMKDGNLQQIGDPIDVYQKPYNRVVADFFSEGITVGEDSFIPLDRLKLAKLEDHADTISFTGTVSNHFIKHGRHFYQIELRNNKKIILSSDDRFQLNERVSVQASEDARHFFTPKTVSAGRD